MKNILQHFPRFLLILSFAELLERFSYHGMRSLLTLYLTELGFLEKITFEIYSISAVVSYGFTVLFGMFADRLFGFLFLCRIGTIFSVLGHLFMFLGSKNNYMIYIGISSISLGTSCFKGNIANLLSSCYQKNDKYSRDSGFTLFYTLINIGCLMSYSICGILSKCFDIKFCFLAVLLGGTLNIIILTIYRNYLSKYDLNISKYIHRNSTVSFIGFLSALVLIISFCMYKIYILKLIIYTMFVFVMLYHFFIISTEKNTKNKNRMIIVSIIIIIAIFYYSIAMQLGSFLSLFLLRHTDRIIWNFEIPVVMVYSIDQIAVIAFGLITSWITSISSRKKTNYLLSRVFIGLASTSISFWLLYIFTDNSENNFRISIEYYLFAMLFIGLGEIMMIPFIVSQISKIAPQKRKGYFMGLLMVAFGFSNFVGIFISKMFITGYNLSDNFSMQKSFYIYQIGFLKLFVISVLLLIIGLILAYLIRKKIFLY